MMQESDPDFWVFGYGSLMWRPGFDYLEQSVAKLFGYHRSLCVYSHVHRGTPERPGLVLGLDRGGSCHGMAFRVSMQDHDTVMAYLRAREQATMVYIESWHRVHLSDGRTVQAVAYTIDRHHKQYAGTLPFARLLELIRSGVGQSGANPDYVIATHEHLQQLGLEDKVLKKLALALKAPD
jgi:cation transport protein ChaC